MKGAFGVARIGAVMRANGALVAAVVQAGLALLLAYGLRINADQLGAINALIAAVVGMAVHWSAVQDVNQGKRNGSTTKGPFIDPNDHGGTTTQGE